MGSTYRRAEHEESAIGHVLFGLLLKKVLLRRTQHLVRQVSNLSNNGTKLNEPLYDHLCHQHPSIHWQVPQPAGDPKRLHNGKLELNDNVLHRVGHLPTDVALVRNSNDGSSFFSDCY